MKTKSENINIPIPENKTEKHNKKKIIHKFPFLKPISKEIARMKMEKSGLPEKKMIKYKAVLNFILAYIKIFLKK